MTREEKIELFDKNQEYAVTMEQVLFKKDTDLEKMKNVFLNLLDKYDVDVVNGPVFFYDGDTYPVKSYLVDENIDFSHFEKIFIYSITENLPGKICVRCLTIPE